MKKVKLLLIMYIIWFNISETFPCQLVINMKRYLFVTSFTIPFLTKPLQSSVCVWHSTSQFRLATFQGHHGHIWWVPTTLESSDPEIRGRERSQSKGFMPLSSPACSPHRQADPISCWAASLFWCPMYEGPEAALTKDRRLGGLEQQMFDALSPGTAIQSEDRKKQIPCINEYMWDL